MSGIISQCYYCITGEPECPEAFENVPTQNHNNTIMPNLNVKICVRFAQRCGCGCGSTLLIHNIPSPPLSSHCISYGEFFQDGSRFLRHHISHHLLPSETLDLLTRQLVLDALDYIDNYPSSASEDGERLVVVPLCIDVIVELDANVNLEDTMDDAGELRMIPASEEAIQSLTKTELDEDVDIDSNQKNECCICLEGLCDSVEVSTLPCQHVFHYSCLVQWLKTSHLCPLCRYPMPIGNKS